MYFTTIATALMAATMAAASPAARNANTARDYASSVKLTFWAAAENTYELYVPVDAVEHSLYSDLSFTYISSNAPASVTCEAYGIDHSVTTLTGSVYNVPIGPPQQQLTAKCWTGPK